MDGNTQGRGEILSEPVKMIASLKDVGIWKKESGYLAGYLFYLKRVYPYKRT